MLEQRFHKWFLHISLWILVITAALEVLLSQQANAIMLVARHRLAIDPVSMMQVFIMARGIEGLLLMVVMAMIFLAAILYAAQAKARLVILTVLAAAISVGLVIWSAPLWVESHLYEYQAFSRAHRYEIVTTPLAWFILILPVGLAALFFRQRVALAIIAISFPAFALAIFAGEFKAGMALVHGLSLGLLLVAWQRGRLEQFNTIAEMRIWALAIVFVTVLPWLIQLGSDFLWALLIESFPQRMQQARAVLSRSYMVQLPSLTLMLLLVLGVFLAAARVRVLSWLALVLLGFVILEPVVSTLLSEASPLLKSQPQALWQSARFGVITPMSLAFGISAWVYQLLLPFCQLGLAILFLRAFRRAVRAESEKHAPA